MNKTTLIIDDEKAQADGLAKVLRKIFPGIYFEALSEEAQINKAIEEKYFALAIVDLRMDKFKSDGVAIIKKIFEVNPIAQVIIVSAFTAEYLHHIRDLASSGKIYSIMDKEPLDEWTPKLEKVLTTFYSRAEENSSEVSAALKQLYAEVRNESDTYIKGKKFEHFISLLFGTIGYREIRNRFIDLSRNEVDLIVRNEIDDTFLNKFSKYILIECKNYFTEGVGKNDLIMFQEKLQNTNGLSELGIIATTSYIAKTTRLEALRSSKGTQKVIFLSNTEIIQLIQARDVRESFKSIIDDQVKDNPELKED